MIFLNLHLVFLKRSLDNVSLDRSAKITPSCDCSVIATYNLSNLTNQRVYKELVYRKGLFKGMITGSAAHSLPPFPPVLLLSSRSLNSAGPAISESGTGYCSTHVPNLTDELSTAKERHLNQFDMAVLAW